MGMNLKEACNEFTFELDPNLRHDLACQREMGDSAFCSHSCASLAHSADFINDAASRKVVRSAEFFLATWNNKDAHERVINGVDVFETEEINALVLYIDTVRDVSLHLRMLNGASPTPFLNNAISYRATLLQFAKVALSCATQPVNRDQLRILAFAAIEEAKRLRGLPMSTLGYHENCWSHFPLGVDIHNFLDMVVTANDLNQRDLLGKQPDDVSIAELLGMLQSQRNYAMSTSAAVLTLRRLVQAVCNVLLDGCPL